ncbi:DNA alkylation repair enzyme [Achlya hypogyna]|uniref:DNA alkylation repair enzyme n=1 Tax=Achlya hypogyna TaxID=1202772 RepID=A0A1V9Y8S3_ACHHY|nr:DNA alkylation repair enzyme [Achlya hypogyna]
MRHTLLASLEALANPAFAKKAERFFRREYCPDDIFIGIRTPQCRDVLKNHLAATTIEHVRALLDDPRHEMRLTGFIALADVYQRPSKAPLWAESQENDDDVRRLVCRVLLEHTHRCNNWDIVDSCVHKTLGPALVHFHRDAMSLYMASSEQRDVKLLPDWYQKLLGSNDLWETRMSIVLLLGVKAYDLAFVFAICEHQLARFFEDPMCRCTLRGARFESLDLIHKALGWVLRECGKLDRAQLMAFLDVHAMKASKTTVRYATEHMPKTRAKAYVALAMNS